MTRAVLLSLSLTLAVTACGGPPDGPAVVAGVAAGDVGEVAGTVTATRAGQTRVLAAGGEVSGDDVIDTGADGRVTITLRHNGVPWTLGAGRKEAVGTSLAWRARRTAGQVGAISGERSTAAGRHAEREAAETAASGAAPPAAAPAAAAPGGPAPTGTAATGAPAEEQARAALEARAEQAQMDSAKADEAAAQSAKLAAEPGADLAADLAPPPPVRATRKPSGGGGGGDEPGLGRIGTIGKGAGGGGTGYGRGGGSIGVRVAEPAPGGATVGTVKVTGPLSAAVLTRIVRARTSQLAYCAEQAKLAVATAVTLELTIGADGTVTDAVATPGPAPLTACMVTVMKRMTVPTANKGSTVIVPVSFQPAAGR